MYSHYIKLICNAVVLSMVVIVAVGLAEGLEGKLLLGGAFSVIGAFFAPFMGN